MSDNEVVVNDRDFWVLGASLGMLALALGVLFVCVFLLLGRAQDAAETHNAVCVYRSNLLEQAHETQKYLLEHPDGAPALGITAAQLQQTLERQRAAAESLAGLNCN